MAAISNNTNTCKACKQEFPIDMFYRSINRHGKVYARNECKRCVSERVQQRKAEALQDPQEAERRKLWRREHKRKLRRAMGCRLRSEIIPKPKPDKQPMQHDHHVRRFNSVIVSRRRAREYQKAKYADPAYRRLVAQKRKANPKTKLYAAKYMSKYNKTPHMRLHHRMSNMIRESLNGSKARRSWECLVGYTREELMRHIELQFVRGMTWANMGEWHIDHIIPRAKLKYTSSDEPNFKACWAITNLQPLWAMDNIAKGDRVLTLV